MMNQKLAALVAAPALALTLGLGLVGCGAAPAAQQAPAATEATTTQTTTNEKTDATATQQSAPAATTTESTTPAPAPAATPQDAYIGNDAAMAAALADAGFAASDVSELQCELDLDDATVHYDVDFKQGGYEYDYDIDATTGQIIFKNAEVDD